MKVQSKKLNPPFSIKTNGREDAKEVIQLLVEIGLKANEFWNREQLNEKYYDQHLDKGFVNVNSENVIELHTHSCDDDVISRKYLLKEISKPEDDPKDVAFNNSSEWTEKLTKENPWSIKVTEEMMNPDRMSLEEFETKCGQNFSSKPIIGYKLIKPEYKEAAEIIAFNHIPNLKNRSFIYQNGACFTEDCKVKDNLEEAGVMHWFEEVYEQESITLKSGVKLSEDDIAEVKEILNTGSRNNNLI